MATIRDVAKEAGLSTGTISKALSTPERVSPKNLAKVEAAIKKLNYKPNMLSQKFRSKSSKTIVVMVPDISNVFFAKVISGIETVAQQEGYSVLLGDTKDSASREEEFIKMVETRLADGIINLRPHTDDATLPREGITAVNSTSSENTPYPSVRIDNVGAAAEVVKHLISLGHKRIGALCGLKGNPHAKDRLEGYKQALASANLDFDPTLLFEGNFNYDSGLKAAQYFLSLEEPPTALFAMNDEMAIAAIKGLTDAGLEVPNDMSITGFDDMEVSQYVRPTLTTIAQPADKIGEQSAKLLLELLSGETPEKTEYVLPHEFIIRQSTCAPK